MTLAEALCLLARIDLARLEPTEAHFGNYLRERLTAMQDRMTALEGDLGGDYEITVTIDPELARRIRQAADRQGL